MKEAEEKQLLGEGLWHAETNLSVQINAHAFFAASGPIFLHVLAS